MSTTFNMHEAKTHFAKLVERALAGEEIIVAKAGKPQVRLVPVADEHPVQPQRRPLGMDRGKVRIHDDWDDPLPEFEEYM